MANYSDPVCHDALNAHLTEVSERLAALPQPKQSDGRALRVAELAGALSASAQAVSANHAALEAALAELNALEAAG